MSLNSRLIPRGFPVARAFELRLFGFALWAFVFHILLGGRECEAEDSDRPLNVVIILADDLGYGDLGCYGARDIPTPNLDALAASGVRFTDFYAASSVCTPSRAALLTGCYPRRVDLTRVLHPHEKRGLAPVEQTISSVLRNAGYQTACFGKWHLGHMESFFPEHHGFEQTLVVPYSHDMYRGAPWASGGWTGGWPDYIPLLQNGQKMGELRGLTEFAGLTARFLDAATRFIEKSGARPFLLYLPLTLPHLELLPPDGWRGRSARGPYGDAVAELDSAVGRIMGALKRCQMDDRTLVVFTSDNGPARVYQKPSFAGGSSGPFSGGKATAFEGGFRVPCIMSWPGKIPPGSVCSALCTSMDLLPTLASLCKARCSPAPLDGKNIRELLDRPSNGASPYEGFLYYKDETPVAVRSGRYKLWLPESGTRKDTQPRLYDLETDPAELDDLSVKNPDRVIQMQSLAARLAVPENEIRKLSGWENPNARRIAP